MEKAINHNGRNLVFNVWVWCDILPGDDNDTGGIEAGVAGASLNVVVRHVKDVLVDSVQRVNKLVVRLATVLMVVNCSAGCQVNVGPERRDHRHVQQCREFPRLGVCQWSTECDESVDVNLSRSNNTSQFNHMTPRHSDMQ